MPRPGLRLSLFWLLLLGTSIDVTFSKRLDRKLSHNRIVGGQEAAEGAAPYQVSIQTVWQTHICGGVILDKEWILTAGHCALDYGISDIRIVVGTNNRLEPGQLLVPDEALVHCLYDVPHLYNNDIGLIHVNESIIMNERTQAVQLSSEQPPAGATVTLTGWGAPESSFPTVERLQTLNLTIIGHEECREAWDYHTGIDIGHICTLTRAGEGACSGDSGGPIMWEGKLVGLVNWGRPCGVGLPDMYANTVYYQDWIRRTPTGCKNRVN
ncbi:chymotrypsin-2 [Drosophila subobscura]|uniref:chymotrypsin-2 n=1 Tax=Drosophila subobscura TaxID=7241 RepID=UPI00155B1B7E|nr:chymotrypsin-2 [Drosophila subobscura]